MDGTIRHVRASTRRENSEDSIEVLSTTDSILPDDLTAITEEEAEQHFQSNGVAEEAEEEQELRTREPPGAEPAAGGDVLSQAEGDNSPRTSRSWRGSRN